MQVLRTEWRLAATLCALVLVMVAPARAQEVTVTFDVTDPGPGATVVATLATTDASTIESATWTQAHGVVATVTPGDATTATIVLGAEGAFKDFLVETLAEPPVSEAQLPDNVELTGGYYGGLQDLFAVVGINPFALEEAALVAFDVEVVTSSGTYMVEADIHTMLPWKTSGGIENVAIGIPVLLHGKPDQTAYDWMLTPAAGSSATLNDATTQDPWFTPDVAGAYQLTVTDEAAASQVALTVYAGTWRGVITGEDDSGRPVASNACTGCHSGGAPDAFTPWAQTGHAEIFTDMLNTRSYYGEGCFSCHTVGYDPDVDNGGIDDAEGYDDFLNAGLIGNPDPGNWATMLASHAPVAQLANIQCENCHGPQNSNAHQMGAPRQNLSANVCATCHGEPTRHARFQQWQLSKHANYKTAVEEGEGDRGRCSKCHTANGFLAWMPMLTDGDATNDTDDPSIVLAAEDIHPQTCQTCHDPHMIGTESGDDPTVTIRISGDTPALMAGFTATDVGAGAICMTCHNSRRGLRNDNVFNTIFGTSDASRAPHLGPQSDVLMGQNLYGVTVGSRSYHSQIEDSCVACHMEETPPPAALSNDYAGTNHTFAASKEICSSCHQFYTAADVQGPVAMQMEELRDLIEQAFLDIMSSQIAAGASIDFDGEHTVGDAAEISELVFDESHGQQAIWVHFADGTETVEPIALNSIDVVPATGDPYGLYSLADARLVKAGWNYSILHADGSLGVHNPPVTKMALETSIEDVEDVIEEGGGGTGDSCSSRYWTEIAAHNEGIGSVWRTDLVTRNASSAPATVEIMLHTNTGDHTLPATNLMGMAQGVFEDIVGLLGVEGKGALEICSTQPLEVISRVYNQTDNGTFGQFIDGYMSGFGLAEGGTARLLGLNQSEGRFRTNISVTNTGTIQAEVEITLYATDASQLHSYTLTVDPGMVVQDSQPFDRRAHRPDVGWAFAEVEVITGSGILCSASVVDALTGDATTIPMKL